MKIASILIIISTLISFSVLWIRADYSSAFEADQACHSIMYIRSKDSIKESGCDHDLETRQWILFERNDNNQPAQVIQRFRY